MWRRKWLRPNEQGARLVASLAPLLWYGSMLPALFFAFDCVGQCAGSVELAQGFEHSGGVDGDGAILRSVVDEVAGE